MRYEYLDHTADAGIRAVGSDLVDALTGAALGMLHLQVPPGGEDLDAATATRAAFVLEADDEEDLVLEWLSGLLADQDIRGVLFVDAGVETIESTDDGLRLRAFATGYPASALRGRIESEVKAVTAYGLRVARGPEGVEVRCVVDL